MFARFTKISWLIVCLLLVANTALAAPFLHDAVGRTRINSATDSAGNNWVTTASTIGPVNYGPNEYFYVRVYNLNNDGAFRDYYVRSTDTQVFYGYPEQGYEVLVFQIGDVGTQWNCPTVTGYLYFEITSIGVVTVPYGAFATVYGVSYCEGGSGASGLVGRPSCRVSPEECAPAIPTPGRARPPAGRRCEAQGSRL